MWGSNADVFGKRAHEIGPVSMRHARGDGQDSRTPALARLSGPFCSETRANWRSTHFPPMKQPLKNASADALGEYRQHLALMQYLIESQPSRSLECTDGGVRRGEEFGNLQSCGVRASGTE